MAIVDENRNFIFIHIFKTAGNSVRKAMGMAAKEFMGGHVDAKDVKRALSRKGKADFFEDAFKFTFVRNPFDWLVSLYHHMKSSGEGYRQAPVKKQNMDFHQALRYIILDLMQRDKKAGTNKYQSQYEFVTDENGLLLVDYLGRFEDLDFHVQEICRTLDIPYEGVPLVNIGADRGGRDYHDYYTTDDIAIVEEHLGNDLEFFGYEF